MSLPPKLFNLIWNQSDAYWLCVSPIMAGMEAKLAAALGPLGFKPMADNPKSLMLQSGRAWGAHWQKAHDALVAQQLIDLVQVAVIASLDAPAASQIEIEKRSVAAIENVARSLWLGEALLEDRVLCYLQPVIDGRGNVFGYESFVRVKEGDKLIAGDRIVEASRALGIEFVIDRHLHVQAIKTFASCGGSGALFVNFFPGFIHRPAVYLEGLSDAVKSHGLIAKNIVLDVTQAEIPRDLSHLRNVVEYCRSRGYALALDDIGSFETAERLVPQMRPDFVKIDRALVQRLGQVPAREAIHKIVAATHKQGGVALAEGVETEAQMQELKRIGVDLFQGYYFSPPIAASEVAAKYGAPAAIGK